MALPQLIPSPSSSALPQKPTFNPNPIPSPLNPNPNFLSPHLRRRRQRPGSLRCSASSFSERHPTNQPKSDDVVELPIFPLPLVLFPGAILPLQIFEFRYRMMMHSLLQTDLRFGVIYSDVVSGTADVGCVGEVVKHECLVNDWFFLICKGQERLQITDLVRTQPHLVVEVKWLADRPSNDGEDDLEALANDIRVKV